MTKHERLLREFIKHSLKATREPAGLERHADVMPDLTDSEDFPSHLRDIGVGPERNDTGPVPPNSDDEYMLMMADPYTRFTGI